MGKKIDVDHLGAMRDVARGLGISRQRVAQIVNDDPSTPGPVVRVAAGAIPLYDLNEWGRWAKHVGRTWDGEKARNRERDESSED